jgi:hypothetical protein
MCTFPSAVLPLCSLGRQLKEYEQEKAGKDAPTAAQPDITAPFAGNGNGNGGGAVAPAPAIAPQAA